MPVLCILTSCKLTRIFFRVSDVCMYVRRLPVVHIASCVVGLSVYIHRIIVFGSRSRQLRTTGANYYKYYSLCVWSTLGACVCVRVCIYMYVCMYVHVRFPSVSCHFQFRRSSSCCCFSVLVSIFCSRSSWFLIIFIYIFVWVSSWRCILPTSKRVCGDGRSIVFFVIFVCPYSTVLISDIRIPAPMNRYGKNFVYQSTPFCS